MHKSLNWNEILKRLFFLYDVGTQDDLGKKLDVSQDLISKWKRGITRPTWDLIERVVQEKGVAWDWLLTGDGEEPRQTESAAPPSSRYGAEHSPEYFTLEGQEEFNPVDIVFNLQKSLSGFQSLLADVGHYVAAGQTLKGYNDLHRLISTVRELKGLCESVSASLEVYRQDDEGQDRTA